MYERTEGGEKDHSTRDLAYMGSMYTDIPHNKSLCCQ